MSSYTSLTSYQDAYNRAKRARDKTVGKKLDKNTLLFMAPDDTLRVMVRGFLIATIQQDDTVELSIPGTVSGYYYHKWLGLYSLKHASSYIGLIHERQFPYTETPGGIKMYDFGLARQQLVPAVDGVKFNMVTGECLNPLPWPVRVDQPDKAREWRRRWSRFRRTFRIMAKVGAFDYIKLSQIEHTDPPAPETFYDAVVQEDYHGIAQVLAWHGPLYKRSSYHAKYCTSDEFYSESLDCMYARMRADVRKCAGCYIMVSPRDAA